ncbi:hypothetical protein D3C77_416610 [compost metagenome]
MQSLEGFIRLPDGLEARQQVAVFGTQVDLPVLETVEQARDGNGADVFTSEAIDHADQSVACPFDDRAAGDPFSDPSAVVAFQVAPHPGLLYQDGQVVFRASSQSQADVRYGGFPNHQYGAVLGWGGAEL